ncbi:FAD-binding oxidoreductase [Aquipuribacter hungaricus]|uniref:FAD-binding oxidoreductase n=1 Tax=Aquipuribacter hungaricus TaxID=545624 RepID=A0ABV7WJ62_9MICO
MTGTSASAGPAGPAGSGSLTAPTSWATGVVREVRHHAGGAVVLRLAVDGMGPRLPGQHVVVRLRADDGYTASRSYSVASDPADPLVELYVERLVDGEVSGYLGDVVEVGDELEVRGPVGGWFVWDGVRPALAVGGGSGVVPLVSMLRHAGSTGHPDRVCLVAAARTLERLPYADELVGGCQVVALSQERSPAGREPGRLVAADLEPLLRTGQQVFVCGSSAFAEHASRLVVDLGVPAADVRVERFGPSG